ncbi:MAG: hypothetical protein COA94_06290, partial [Rickettsiales bacterium]
MLFGVEIGLDMVIVIGFLVLTLVVGMGHGKSVKTIKDYALGGRNFSTAALTATIVATWASGSGFFVTMSKTYSDGLPYMFARFGIGIYFLIVSFLLVPRMGEFLGKISIAEAMGDLYGRHVRVITAIAGTIGAVGSVAVQLKVFGSIFSYFLDLSHYVTIIVAGVIVTVYSAFGGIRAVTFTDMLQFFAFGIIIPVIGFIIWNDFYQGSADLTYAMSDPRFNITEIFSANNINSLEMTVLFCYFAMPTISAAAFQRISIGNNIAQVKKAFLIAGTFLIVIQVITAWIPFLIHALDPSLASDQLLGYIIDTYTYPGLKGFIMVAILAFAMSTADSRINSASVLFTNDIYKLALPNLTNEIFVSRLFAFILGGGSIMLALFETDILGILVLANSFYYPVVTPPFLLTVFGFRSSKKSVLIGMAAGFSTVVIWKLLPVLFTSMSQKIVGVLFAMFVNAVFLMASHYLLRQKGGWVGVKDTTYIDEQRIIRKKKWAAFMKKFQSFKLIKTIKEAPVPSESTCVMMGIYFILFTVTIAYSTDIDTLKDNGNLVSIIYQIMMVTGTVMAMYPIWPMNIKQKTRDMIIRIWYPVTMFYMMVFFSAFFVLLSDSNTLHYMIFTANIITLIILIGWQVGAVMIIVGTYMAVQFYKYYMGIEYLDISLGSPQFILVYSLVFVGVILMIFLKPKQERLEQTEHRVGELSDEVGTLVTVVSSRDSQISTLDTKVSGLEERVDHYTERTTNQAQEIERLGATAQR